MDDSVKFNQNQPDPGQESGNNQTQNPNPVSVTVGGGSEGAPTTVNPEITTEEVGEYLTSSETEPQISEEEARVGVERVTQPKISTEAMNAGVKPSIPSAPTHNFKTTFTDEIAAQAVVKKGDTKDAVTWSAAEFIKDLHRKFFNKPKPSQV